MQPLKFAASLANWSLRVAALVLVYIIFFVTYRSFDLHSLDFWIACAFGVFAILLFAGGFMKKHSLTVFSAIVLVLGCLAQVFMHFAFGAGKFVAMYAVFAAIALYFAAFGNRKK
jgi:hypothetical protein